MGLCCDFAYVVRIHDACRLLFLGERASYDSTVGMIHISLKNTHTLFVLFCSVCFNGIIVAVSGRLCLSALWATLDRRPPWLPSSELKESPRTPYNYGFLFTIRTLSSTLPGTVYSFIALPPETQHNYVELFVIFALHPRVLSFRSQRFSHCC